MSQDDREYLKKNGWRFRDGAWWDAPGGWPDEMMEEDAVRVQMARDEARRAETE